MKVLLFKDRVVLKKFQGKGGWTYAALPGVKKDKNNYFGWIEVSGSIDSYTFSSYKLTSMGNGNLFLPVKAAVRKLIKKEEGEYVDVELYREILIPDINQAFAECLRDEPEAELFFRTLSDAQREAWMNWISSSLNEDLQIDRMAGAVEKLRKGVSTPS